MIKKSLIIIALHVLTIACLIPLGIYIYENTPLFLLVFFFIFLIIFRLTILTIIFVDEIIPHGSEN